MILPKQEGETPLEDHLAPSCCVQFYRKSHILRLPTPDERLRNVIFGSAIILSCKLDFVIFEDDDDHRNLSCCRLAVLRRK